MADDETDIVIPQEIKEDYEYIKCIVEGSDYSINWSQALEILDGHIRQNSPERPLLTAEYIDCLMYATCFYNNFDLARWLINNGADVDFQDPESGNTLLHLAALNGNVKLAELLIDNGAHFGYNDDVIANLQGNTLLHLAAEYGHDEFIQLIRREVKLKSVNMDDISDIVNYKNKKGNTVLHLATKNGHIKCLELVLDLYYWGRKESLANKYFSVVFIFLLALFTTFVVSKVIYISYGGSIAVGVPMLLVIVGTICIVMISHEKERSEHPLLTEDSETLLHLAIKNLQKENDQDQYFQCAKLLIKATPRFKINAQDKEGKTALCLAAEKGLVECVKLLLKRKADVEVMANNEETALHLAIKNSNYECTALLIKNITAVESKQRKWKLKLHKLYSVVNDRYCYIKSHITNLILKIKEKIWFKENWYKKILCLAIEQQFKNNLGNTLWPAKREIILELLKIINKSDIDEVYNYAKSYAKRKGVQDGEYVLRTFDNFFRTHERYKNKNFSKLKKQKSWYKDYILHCSNISLTILAVLSLLKQNSNLSKNSDFVAVENTTATIANIIAIFTFLLSARLYLKHKEFNKVKDFKDKIKEIEKLLVAKKEQNIEAQDGSPYRVADTIKQQRKRPFLKSLATFKQRKVYSDNNLETIPLLCSRLIETRRSLPNEVSELEQVFQAAIKQLPILNKKSTNNLKCKKTSNIKLIKNPLFNVRTFSIDETSVEKGRRVNLQNN